jgi:hypothetical protein
LKKGVHTSDRFQKLDCHICKKGDGEVQWQCEHFPKAVLKACKGFFVEEEAEKVAFAEKLFS